MCMHIYTYVWIHLHIHTYMWKHEYNKTHEYAKIHVILHLYECRCTYLHKKLSAWTLTLCVLKCNYACMWACTENSETALFAALCAYSTVAATAIRGCTHIWANTWESSRKFEHIIMSERLSPKCSCIVVWDQCSDVHSYTCMYMYTKKKSQCEWKFEYDRLYVVVRSKSTNKQTLDHTYTIPYSFISYVCTKNDLSHARWYTLRGPLSHICHLMCPIRCCICSGTSIFWPSCLRSFWIVPLSTWFV